MLLTGRAKFEAVIVVEHGTIKITWDGIIVMKDFSSFNAANLGSYALIIKIYWNCRIWERLEDECWA
jgi:hypothetical protein